MNGFIKSLLGGVALWLAKHFQAFSIDLLKIRAAIWYLRAVRTARQAYLLHVNLTLSVALAGAGFLMFHIGLFALLPPPFNAIALMVLGCVYTVVGLYVVNATCSEQKWMRLTGADKCASLASKPRDD